jgi:hypothetical protein
MDQSLLAAIARFPDRGRAIEELADDDEEFRSLCADYADADAALVRWENCSSQVREERCTEYRGLLKDLALEIEAALDCERAKRRQS